MILDWRKKRIRLYEYTVVYSFHFYIFIMGGGSIKGWMELSNVKKVNVLEKKSGVN